MFLMRGGAGAIAIAITCRICDASRNYRDPPAARGRSVSPRRKAAKPSLVGSNLADMVRMEPAPIVVFAGGQGHGAAFRATSRASYRKSRWRRIRESGQRPAACRWLSLRISWWSRTRRPSASCWSSTSAGRISASAVSTAALPCGGAEIHGWVTGTTRIASVELLLDGGSLGPASFNNAPRTDIAATTPVQGWRISLNLDTTGAGEHLIRAVGTDVNGNRSQFASQRVIFGGPGKNCFTRRRTSSR